MEFVFALVILLGFVCILYQALHFELDIFNRLNLLRYEAFKEAHRNQQNTEASYFAVTTEFQPIAKLPVQPPFQMADETIVFPAKRYVMRRGARYYEPPELLMHGKLAFLALMQATEYSEDSAGTFGNLAVYPGVAVRYATSSEGKDDF